MAKPVPKGSAKKITRVVNLQLQAGKATPAPPVGTVLGPAGINIMEFCNAFNKQTKDLEPAPYPVLITIYGDRSFTFVIKKPPVSHFLKKRAGITSGSKTPGKKDGVVAELDWTDIVAIAEAKMCDMTCNSLEAAARVVLGSAKSMGIHVRVPAEHQKPLGGH